MIRLEVENSDIETLIAKLAGETAAYSSGKLSLNIGGTVIDLDKISGTLSCNVKWNDMAGKVMLELDKDKVSIKADVK